MMTQRVGCEMNDRFAAIAPFAGQQAIGFNCGPKIEGHKIGIINVWGTSDRVVPGDGSASSDGFWYAAVDDVQRVFAEYNQCDTSYPASVYEHASVDCDDCEWQCFTYDEGNECQQTVQCSFDGKHNYPTNGNGNNYALPVVWEYFKTFSQTRAANGYCTVSVDVVDDARKGGKGGDRKKGKGGKKKGKKKDCGSITIEYDCDSMDGCEWIDEQSEFVVDGHGYAYYLTQYHVGNNWGIYLLVGMFLCLFFVYQMFEKDMKIISETTPLNV